MRAKLTKRSVESAKPDGRDVFLWDTEVSGFGCKITPKGRRVFVLQYWANGRARRVTLGRYGSELTVDQARTQAKRLRGQVADGGDPAGARAKTRAMPSVKEYAARYLHEHAAEHKRPSSRAADRRNIDNHIVPLLGNLKVSEVTRTDVERFKREVKEGKTAKREKIGSRKVRVVKGGPGAANRCLALLSKMFNLAEAWGLRPDGSNPTHHVQKYQERRFERFLSDAELARMGAVLAEATEAGEHSSVVAAIRLLILTGCRRNEILELKWDYVDFERGCLRLPETKTGAKVVPLGAPALELLAGLARIEGNGYALPGKRSGHHFVGLEKAWFRLRKRAALEDVRLHDLRHTHASVGASTGESLVLIGALLGHRQAATTQRYAHLSDDPVKAAADRISGHLAAAMAGKSGKVVSIADGRKLK